MIETNTLVSFSALTVALVSLLIAVITGIDTLRSNVRIWHPSIRTKLRAHYHELNRTSYLCANSATTPDDKVRSRYHCFNVAKWRYRKGENARAYCNRCVVKHMSDVGLLG